MQRKGLEEGRDYYVLAHKDREEDRFVYVARGDAKVVAVFSEREKAQQGLDAILEKEDPSHDTTDLALCPCELDDVARIIGGIDAMGYVLDYGTNEVGWAPLYPPFDIEDVRLSGLSPHRRYYIVTPNPEQAHVYFVDHGWGRVLPIFKTVGAARRYSKALGRPKPHMELFEEAARSGPGAEQALKRITAGDYRQVELNADVIKEMVAQMGITHYVLNPDENTRNSEAVSVKE